MGEKLSMKRIQKLRPKNSNLWISLTVGLLVLAIALYFLASPLKRNLANGYIERGERKLAECSYVTAKVEFMKAEWLSAGSAKEKLEDASAMQQSIVSGEKYFKKYNNTEALQLLSEAESIPQSESEGLKKVKAMVEAGQPQLAEVAANILIEMNEDSAKAWAYYGISAFESARITQMTEEGRSVKLNSAKFAFEKALAIDPRDEISEQYIVELKNLR